MNDYQTFIHVSRYARWRDEDGRRETWPETVARYIDNVVLPKVDGQKDGEFIREQLSDAITNLDVMPSMRMMMTAGPALERCNVAGYNCAYLTVDSPRSFDEAMYILLCGTGVGFSVERKYVEQLPRVNEHFEQSDTVIHVGDSKAGWSRSLRELVSLLYGGQIPRWDTSRVRPAGARLITFGGRASGPGPLEDLFRFTINTFQRASGRRLTSLECHDLMCKIGEVVVVGGVRRSAMISLSDVDDSLMRNAKRSYDVISSVDLGDYNYFVTYVDEEVRTGVFKLTEQFDRESLNDGKIGWWVANPQRALANNSSAYRGQPSHELFMSEWQSLYQSKSGERGIFNRAAASNQAARSGRRKTESIDFGTNPCSEIILRPFQFCNLTEVVVRADDTRDTLRSKVILATILGTIQSSFTNFKYLRKIWKNNCEEERLLGVSFTGIFDNLGIFTPDLLTELKELAIETNIEWASRLGINPSTAITCVKPSGTVSQLVDAASGIHPRWSWYYVRTVRADNKDPLTQFLIREGIPHEPDVTKPLDTTVFSFPQRAPAGGTTRDSLTAIEHLEVWKLFQDYWCEHKPSVTINIRENEWFDVQAWVWRHFDQISGVAFLPFSEHTYRQAPYQECTEQEYDKLVNESPPSINWEAFKEDNDGTTGSQEFACTGNVCELVDVSVPVQS